MLNYNTGATSLLPGNAGSQLLNPLGLTVDASGTIIVAEKDRRRIASIDPTSGAISTLIDGFVAPSDVLYIGTTLYISDQGANEVRTIECGAPSAMCGLTNISSTPTFACANGMKTATITWMGNDASVTFNGGAGATPPTISAATGSSATFTYSATQGFFNMSLTDTEGFCNWSYGGTNSLDCSSMSCTTTGGSTCGSAGHPMIAGLYNNGTSSNTFSHGNNAMVGRTVFLCGGQSFCSTGANDGYGIDGNGSTYYLAMGGDGVKSINFNSGTCGENWINTTE